MSISVELHSSSVEASGPSDQPINNTKVSQTQWINAFYPSPLSFHDKFRKNIVYVSRCEENLADAFGPNWKTVATATGKYLPFDLNMPLTIPALKYSSLESDPPLSILGRFAAIARAKAMLYQHIKIDVILTPPTLRCVQTAAAYTSVYKKAHIVVLSNLVEPEVILERGMLTTISGKYMNIETLRKAGFEVQDSDFVEVLPLAKPSELPIMIMKRIHDTILEHISKIPGGPILIIGDCLVLKIAEAMASIPNGYQDLLADVPFKVPDMTVDTVEKMTHYCYDFTELREHYPYGSTSVFLRNRDGQIHRLHRLPVMLHPVTIVSGQKQQTHLKYESTETSQPESVQTENKVYFV